MVFRLRCCRHIHATPWSCQWLWSQHARNRRRPCQRYVDGGNNVDVGRHHLRQRTQRRMLTPRLAPQGCWKEVVTTVSGRSENRT